MTDNGDIKQLQKKKLNICFVAPVPPPYGGIANWTSMVCHYLDRKDIESIRYTVLNTAPKQRVTEGRSLWNRIVEGGLALLRQRRDLKKILRTDDINVVHMTTSGSLSIVRDFVLCRVAKQFEISLVYHIHFGRIPEMQKSNSWEWKIIRTVFKNVDAVIAIDKKTYNALYSTYGQKISYIPNPIDIEDLPEREKHPENIVMYLGWVIKEKGIEELLEAWEKVYQSYDDWTLRIVGPYKKEYYEYLAGKYDMNGVQFLGEQPHATAMQMLNKASIFVLPSYTEGCPYVIMEAMALGKSIIGTSVGNITEMLSGDCGVIIQNPNSRFIEDAMSDLLMNCQKREVCGKLALKKVTEEFAIEKVISLYADCWRHV